MGISSEEIIFITHLQPHGRYDKTYRNRSHMTVWKIKENVYTYSYHRYHGSVTTKAEVTLETLLKDWFTFLKLESGQKRMYKKYCKGGKNLQ